ncbi:hypothetical protein [Rhizobium sullae]|uniref:Uncharacterized protein n=1 Tax=Rhizobium sullae TaxID=50338 RepID=A0A2N0D4T3_RHISU|nr:hypothetical protein [Rhizobium sullae]PKA41088.1 hypothetical protein CWR43_22905 [Rhizobium sullae]UWU12646.1 hypothetical protein N2599_10630 [Rhizobium sullae]
MQLAALSTAVFLVASGALAQDNQGFGQKLGAQDAPPPGGQASMGELLSRGYEIKAAVPNGNKFVVFMQKDQSAYACEMQSLTASRCGTLN